jgi:putative Mg2+ transporter-C (MgtC) family protein
MRFPTDRYAHHVLRFARNEALSEEEVRGLLERHEFKIASLAYELSLDHQVLEYQMTIRTVNPENFAALAATLGRLPRVRAFVISPRAE